MSSMVDHVETVGDSPRGRAPQGLGGALKVVETVEEVLGQVPDGIDPV